MKSKTRNKQMIDIKAIEEKFKTNFERFGNLSEDEQAQEIISKVEACIHLECFIYPAEDPKNLRYPKGNRIEFYVGKPINENKFLIGTCDEDSYDYQCINPVFTFNNTKIEFSELIKKMDDVFGDHRTVDDTCYEMFAFTINLD